MEIVRKGTIVGIAENVRKEAVIVMTVATARIVMIVVNAAKELIAPNVRAQLGNVISEYFASMLDRKTE